MLSPGEEGPAWFCLKGTPCPEEGIWAGSPADRGMQWQSQETTWGWHPACGELRLREAKAVPRAPSWVGAAGPKVILCSTEDQTWGQ